LEAVRDTGVLVRLWGWSGLIWALSISTQVLGLRAMGVDVDPLVPPLLVAVHMAGHIVPTLPMQLGVHHYLTVLTLSAFGVAPSQALSSAILLHLVVYLPMILGGALGFWVEGCDWGAAAPDPRGRS